tara:strand:+ start:206 stop:925 length:720 start_codon:yes stop_codon:yes gene_type:complete
MYKLIFILLIFILLYKKICIKGGKIKKTENPIINLDHLINQKKLIEINNKLIKDIKTTKDLTNFTADEKKHGLAISLTEKRLSTMKKQKLCIKRKQRNSSYWKPNNNYNKFNYLVEFIENLDIFENIGNIVIIINKKNETGIEHYDHRCNDWVSEFIWLRTNNKKLFYIKNNKNKKFYVDGNMIWFDDMFRHNISPTNEDTFSIRVDGKFNDKMRNYIYTNGIFKFARNREILLNNKNL